MRSHGLIFDSTLVRLDSASTPSGTVWLDLPEAPLATRWRYRFGHFSHFSHKRLNPLGLNLFSAVHVRPAWRLVSNGLSNGLILVGAAGILLTMLPVVAMEAEYAYKSYMAYKFDKTNMPLEPELVQAPPGPTTDAEAFSVHIPKIDAHSQVIPNVDAGDPAEYAQALSRGVAHAKGTGLPGVSSQINRTIYLFAHSTSAPALIAKYNAQFYLLNKMAAGDDIEVTFWAKPYHYRVVEKKITSPADVSFLQRQTEKEILVLATCTPPGTTAMRLLVIAERTY